MIYESNAIARYLARKGKNLYGANDFQAGQIDQYLDFLSLEIEPALWAILYPIFGFAELDQERQKKAFSDFNQTIRVIENALKDKTYLVNNTLSVADVVYAATL